MTIRFDISTTSVVIMCSECGARGFVVGGKSDADRWAANHQRSSHPGDRKMQGQLQARRRRART